MLHKPTRIAALMGLVALVSAQQTPINCGNLFDYGSSPPSDFSVYHSGSNDFDIRCHSFLRMPIYDWVFTGFVGSADACIDRCAASSSCKAAITDGGDDWCWHSATATLEEGSLERDWPYVVSVKRNPPLNCKDNSSNGRVFTPPGSSAKYQIQCNYQYGGNTLGASKRAETFEDCVGFCDTTAGCVDVVYSDAKYCWLKSTKTNGYASPNWWTAVKVQADNTDPNAATNVGAINCFDNSADNTSFKPLGGSGTYDIRCNFQYDGDTLGSAQLTQTFDKCVDLCDATAGCVDAIWSDAKYCWLKSSRTGAGYKSAGWFSAIKRSNPV